jgi:hypothetical protein
MIEKIRQMLRIKEDFGDVVPFDISTEAVTRNLASLIKSTADMNSTGYTTSGGIIVVKGYDGDQSDLTVAVVVGDL